MKLYYFPGTCSLSPQIVLQEAGLNYQPVLTNIRTHQLADGTDFFIINPLGYVPVLELDGGKRLLEGAAIVQYIADQAPGKKLAPPNGTFERYKLQERLSFISSELHKTFAPIFHGDPEESKTAARAQLRKRFQWIDEQLTGRDYQLGEFSVADAYLFTVTRWTEYAEVDISGLDNLAAFMQRMNARPAVQKALEIEK